MSNEKGFRNLLKVSSANCAPGSTAEHLLDTATLQLRHS